MDIQNTAHYDFGRPEDDLQAPDSCEDTRVPNSPVLAPVKSSSTTPVRDSPDSSVDLNAVEKGNTLSSTPSKPSSRLRRHLQDDVQTEWADMLLLLCWFTTGFLDSTIFNAYGTFVSMQTGNTVLLGLGASNSRSSKHPYRWAKSLVSLISYTTGCIFFPVVTRKLGSQRRSTFIISFIFQAMIIIVSAAVVQKGVVEGRLDYITNDIEWLQVIPIILLSFQAPGQVCGSRQLGYFETPTVVVTTMIYDFGSDPQLFLGWNKNPVRNRRFAGFLAMLLGAVSGGWVTISMGQIHVTLWVAAAIKTSIALAWVVWPRKNETKQWN